MVCVDTNKTTETPTKTGQSVTVKHVASNIISRLQYPKAVFDEEHDTYVFQNVAQPIWLIINDIDEYIEITCHPDANWADNLS